MEDKRIVFVISMLVRGGAERVICILANHYASKGWNVEMITQKKGESYPLDSRIKITEAGVGKVNRPKFILAIRKYMKQHPNCTVVSFQSMINVYTMMASRNLKAKVIVSERNDIKLSNPPYVFKLAQYFYAKADAIVFQSNKVKEYFNQAVRDKGRIILNPVTVECSASERKEKKIVNCARLSPQKNQKMLIRAFSKFCESHPNYDLYIYGEGEMRGELESLVSDLNLKESVFLPGNVEHIHEEIRDAEMFVLSSNFEGLSNAMLECMMMGIPCISTECAGSVEIIRDGDNGILVPVDNEEELVKAIIMLADNPLLREHIASTALNDSDAFKYENVIREWEKVIEQ